MMLFSLLRCTRGAAAVEFAIVSVVFVTVCIAVVDFGRTLYVKNQLSFLADIAARQILINPTVPSATLETDLRNEFVAGDPASLAIAITNETV
ncbi:MAG: TadE family protein, partial [Pseudomonadota bacterium]